MKKFMQAEIPRPWFPVFNQEQERYLELLYTSAKAQPGWDYFPDSAVAIAIESLDLDAGMPIRPLFGKAGSLTAKRYIIDRLRWDQQTNPVGI